MCRKDTRAVTTTEGRMLAYNAACNAQAAIDCEFIVGLAEPICLVRSTPTGRQRNVCSGSMLSKKSLCIAEHKFSEP
jgi:hypothetical protein